MSRIWNWKAMIDSLGTRLWDTSSTYRTQIIEFANEIQNELAGLVPNEYYEFRLKKLIPTEQNEVSILPQRPSAPTTALADGGSLTDGTEYIVYTTFVIYDEDGEKYIETKASIASTARTATGATLQIDLTSIDTYDGDTSTDPLTIYRNIYVSKKASGDTAHGEPFYLAQIADNTTTTYSVTSEPSSTITPPSSTEVSQTTGQVPRFASGIQYMRRVSRNQLKRSDPANTYSATAPTAYDFIGPHKIYLYPKLSSGATTAQRTMIYEVYRLPHEAFYDVDREIDLPIEAQTALRRGIEWLSYDYRDRDGKVSKMQMYEEEKKRFIERMRRIKAAPNHITDVSGGVYGFEV